MLWSPQMILLRGYGFLAVFFVLLSLSKNAESTPNTLISDLLLSDNLVSSVLASDTVASGTLKGTIKNKCRSKSGEVVVYLDGLKKSVDHPLIKVKQKGRRFLPNFVVLPVGAKIQFSNNETREITHNVFSRSPLWSKELGVFMPEDKQIYTFSKPGKIRVLCSVHRDMRLLVFVTPNSYFSEVKQSKYEIKGIAPGEYKVKVWCARTRVFSPSQKVTIRSGKETNLPIDLKCRGRRR